MTDKTKMIAWATLTVAGLTVWAVINRYELTLARNSRPFLGLSNEHPSESPVVYRLDHWTGQVDIIKGSQMSKIEREE